MHPRVCVSAISTFNLSLAEDLAFWDRHDIDTVGVSVAKLERFGWDEGTKLVADAVGRGLRVANLIGLGPFNLAEPGELAEATGPARALRRHRGRGRRRVHGVHDRAVRAAHVGGGGRPARSGARRPCCARRRRAASRSRSSTRTRCASTWASCTRSRTRSTSRAGSTWACAWSSTRAGPSARSQQTIRAGIDRIRLVQVSDFKVGTVASSQRLVPGDGDIPIERILGIVLDAGYEGVFDLELIGDAIIAEGYDAGRAARGRPARRDARASSDA